MRNIRLKLAYDGTNYHGFQRQIKSVGPTVQGTLETVWAKLVEEEVTLAMAGRTDAGVHASGQIVNFMTSARIPEEKIPKAFNSLLPRDIRILEAKCVPHEFNARWSAKWKRYDYLIDNKPIPDIFKRLYTSHVPVPLNVAQMQEAACYLEGCHNFKTFAAAGGDSKRFERTIYRCQVKEEENRLVRVSCVGDGFLYHMVRIIVGTLMDVGKGRIFPQQIPEIIASQDRTQARMIAQAQGLTLVHVNYTDEGPFEVFNDLI
ncbi:tRNA pseudouridine(38-40) synthase TruA [Desulfosporosinus sp.]|uniref:tRNA pseudouridine(38-40) synthase TruA n=1 Tax=Desulfosporosinus sp. TaxID=157907 RepID=UPI0025C519BC|nr:tRNA pseudouridine(38-40) synthase TruA [Desulfosporosinus sp.]MBC2721255.1 tRNA pseudouridine(38-40) synthase TruA [Desulfosporosinus sp.]MBC2728688.1 tRNA pseudouridine(38-40) synthase TruA [Desulfosporosinus sp.]